MNEIKNVTTYRYMWKVAGQDTINFKIVSDIDEGHSVFIENLKKIPDLESAGKEYLHEYNPTKIGLFESIVSPENFVEVEEEEKEV